ncbi:extensin family protein [Altererythrobacter sp. SALINAS58]|nr:extensin family protein [Alteripontixanthobacter muriae]
MAWLRDNPQHDPWAPLDLRDPDGFATAAKWSSLREDVQICQQVLERSAIEFKVLEPSGVGACTRPDRVTLEDSPLTPSAPVATCAVNAAMTSWLQKTVEPAALDIMNSPLASVRHLGTYSCRRLYGRSEGRWSQHATGNAIDIAGFVLEDGTEISIVSDWAEEASTDRKARFLRRVGSGACDVFGTVLSPDYNEAHRDHFHLDQARGNRGVCR